MISGVINDRWEATIGSTVRGPTGRKAHLQAIVDTGFDDFLTLPTRLVDELDLHWLRVGQVMIADGSLSQFDFFEGTVVWDGREITVPVQAVELTPLIGMAMLVNHDIHMRVRPGGFVTISPIPQSNGII